jgi:acyl-[acyl-carrier-protein]-phospholipid O-acyltransferase/long-chain-fatty-acid--[acyl-carrier-protein] ligase
MIKYIYNHPVLKPILKFFKVIPIAPGDAEQALAEVNQALANGEVVCIFPEGAISRNGHLSSFRRGYERAVEGVDGCIVPFYLHGLWGSRFSRASFFQQQGGSGKRDLVVGFGAPLPLTTQAPELKQKVAELSVDTWGKHIDAMHSLGSVYVHRAKQMLARTLCVDTDGEQYSHRQVLSRVLAFNQTLARSQLADNAAVGIALPEGIASLIANLAVISRGHVAVNLDPTMSSESREHIAKRADLALVITTADLVEQWSSVAPCIAIDSLLASSSPAARVRFALAARLLPASAITKLYFGKAGVDIPAAIQFDHEHSDLDDENPATAAILTHRNLLASIKQTACVLDAQADDVLVACTPAWHRFGLTANLLMPAIEGFPMVFTDTDDPLAIAKDAALQNATLLCLDLQQIDALVTNERIHPLMLSSCRFVLCNDESTKAEQIQAFKDKFTTEVYTSFGAAENAFAVSANIPDRLDTNAWKTQVGNKLGTVGLALPGTSCRILNPDDLTPVVNGEVGEVVVSGNQIMEGYLDLPEQTAEKFILWQYRRWLRTGMQGQLDDDGFLTLIAS